MLSVIRQRLLDIRSALWFRPASFCLAVIALCVALPFAGPLLPDSATAMLPGIEHDTVVTLLQVLAGSMLTVTTVSLSVLMLALGLAVAHATPRAVPELMADSTTQNALGTFLAAFVFSLGGLFLLGIDALGERETALLYLLALLLVAAAVIYLMQWIHHIAGVIRINKVVGRIHRQSKRVLASFFAAAQSAEDTKQTAGAPGPEGRTIYPLAAGYILLIDLAALDGLAQEYELTISLSVSEGSFVSPRVPAMLVVADRELDDELTTRLASALVVGTERSAASDPLLGFELLAEVAVRALSPGVNDPQTALICVDYLGDLLLEAAAVAPDDYPSDWRPCGRIWLRQPGFDAMLERAYRPIMRDAAGSAEVMFAVVSALKSISSHGLPTYRELLCQEGRRALDFGLAHLHYDGDKETLTAAVEELQT